MAAWMNVANIIAAAVPAGSLCWLLMTLAGAIGAWRAGAPVHWKELDAAAGAGVQRDWLAAGRQLAALGAGLLAALAVAGALGLAGGVDLGLPGWFSALALLAAVLVLAAAAWRTSKLLIGRRQLKDAWQAQVATGSALKRLNQGGFRVFHDVRVEGAIIHHVVLGTRGVFAVTVVPRRVPRGVRPVVELRNGKLVFGNETDAMPVGEAARNMTLLAAALSRKAGHRVVVRSVIAVPGWNAVPTQGANHLLMNENNLVMLPSWNTPDAYLMDEDFGLLQDLLIQASRNRRIA